MIAQMFQRSNRGWGVFFQLQMPGSPEANQAFAVEISLAYGLHLHDHRKDHRASAGLFIEELSKRMLDLILHE